MIWKSFYSTAVLEELKQLLILAWPIILMSFFRYANPTVSVIICGHLSKEEFNAATLANSIISVFGVAVDQGFSTACDTLFSQIYGSRSRRRLGLMLQRAMMIMTVVYLFLGCLHFNIEPLLILLNQDVEVSRLTARYVAIYFWGLFFDFQYLTMSRYLQNQNIVYPMMISAFVGSAFNAVSQYIAIFVLGYGIDASAILQACGCLVMFLIQLGYVLISGVYKDTWQGFEFRQSLEAWGIFFKLGLPGIVMVGSEQWAFQISNFLAGSLGQNELGAQSVAFNFGMFIFMAHIGTSIAGTIRCGQFLGANQPLKAALTTKVVIVTDMMIAILQASLIVLLRKEIPKLFTSDPDIILLAETLLLAMSAVELFNGTVATPAGIIRSCGLQMQGAVVMIICYYIFGVPLSFILTFVAKMGIVGFWIGLITSLGLEGIVYLTIIFRLNWPREAIRAEQREKQSKLYSDVETESNGNTEYEGLLQFADSESEKVEEEPFDLIQHSRSVSEASAGVVQSLSQPKVAALVPSVDGGGDRCNTGCKRAVLVGFAVTLFLSSLLLKFYLPRRFFVPCLSPSASNSSAIFQLATQKHYPLCNDTAYQTGF